MAICWSFVCKWAQGPTGPGPIWDRAHVGPGPGRARAHMGPGPGPWGFLRKPQTKTHPGLLGRPFPRKSVQTCRENHNPLHGSTVRCCYTDLGALSEVRIVSGLGNSLILDKLRLSCIACSLRICDLGYHAQNHIWNKCVNYLDHILYNIYIYIVCHVLHFVYIYI